MDQQDQDTGGAPARIGVKSILRAVVVLTGVVLTLIILRLAANMGTVTTTLERLEQQVNTMGRDLGNINSRMNLLGSSVVDNQARFGQNLYNIRISMDRMSITLQSVNKDLDDLNTVISNLNNKVKNLTPSVMPWQSGWPR